MIMPFIYKLSIVFFLGGLLAWLLRHDRNWIMSYRSRRALISHQHFAFANRIAGLSFMVFGGCYLIFLLIVDFYTTVWVDDITHGIIIGTYLIIQVVFIEYMLKKHFGDK